MPLYTLHRARSPLPPPSFPSFPLIITLHPPHTTTTCTFTTFTSEAPIYTKSYAEFVSRITNSEEYKQVLGVWTPYPEVAHVEIEGVEVRRNFELWERLQEVLGPVGGKSKGVRVEVWVKEGQRVGSGAVGWMGGGAGILGLVMVGMGVALGWFGL